MSAQKGIILAILLTFSLPVLPQISKAKNMTLADFEEFHFGYSVGIGIASFTIIPKDGYRIDLEPGPMININLISDYRLGKFLNIRFLPGIQYAQRNLTVTDKLSARTKSWKIETIYVDMPILLKYRSERVNNYAPYLIAGINTRFDLGAELAGVWRPDSRMLKTFDFYPELGVGVDFYLSRSKVAAELKFCIGMRNIIFRQPAPDYALYVSGIDKIFSRMVILTFLVEQSQ